MLVTQITSSRKCFRNTLSAVFSFSSRDRTSVITYLRISNYWTMYSSSLTTWRRRTDDRHPMPYDRLPCTLNQRTEGRRWAQHLALRHVDDDIAATVTIHTKLRRRTQLCRA